MTAKLTASLREAPTTVPALAALALFVVWATSQAGYPVTHWAPGALVVLVLLGIALALVRLRVREVPVSVWIAVGALAAYTALSYLSILWAAVPGEAWEGANRTLLYLAVFALFALWRQRSHSAALALCVWTLALIVLAGYVALHVNAAGAAGLQAMLPGGRLLYPSGYPNANAAQWLMAFLPAVLLVRSRGLHWGLRGLLAGGAVLLAEVALLSQSRGSLYATPVVLVLVLALLPGRTRTFAVLIPIGAGVAAAAPAVLRVGDRLREEAVVPANVHSATTAMFAAAAAVAVAVALGAAVESRLGEPMLRRARIGMRALAALALAAAIGGGLAVAGNPVTRLESAWHSFKGGYANSNDSGSRLVGGLGSNRYDFYRVALDEFDAHPLLGIGADNFAQQYLAHGRSEETPRYPHSVELRTLTQTGAIGALIALVGLGAALFAVARALRARDPLARAVAGAALAGFGYWVVHGSVDWFWEFSGLGAPAFALLGLACALAPGRSPKHRTAHAQTAWSRRLGAAAAAALTLAAVASLAAPWLSQLEVQSAARIWTSAPRTAYARLDEAARLNPLSDEAYLIAGSIALRYGELGRAERAFSNALERSGGDAYATLERGAIASTKGERALALSLLERAVRLDPREPLTRQALQVVRAGRRVSIERLNRSILLKAQQLA
ncbi:MAG TPA: O-antigen ligase family protein [Solirubrobacteraceae bacterium]|jgi:O-antigen ligase|nr:O-antigen ligase family protein [Solirubrobacteraceae bacterium]